MLVYAANRRDDERARSHAVFLAYRDQIMELHRNGWPYADIWRAMRDDGIVGFSYSSFLRYARRLGEQPAPPSPPIAPRPAEPAKPDSGMQSLHSWPKAGNAGGKPITPGSTRVDMPVFGKNHKPRDPNSF